MEYYFTSLDFLITRIDSEEGYPRIFCTYGFFTDGGFEANKRFNAHSADTDNQYVGAFLIDIAFLLRYAAVKI